MFSVSSRNVNVFFKYANMLCGLLVISCEVVQIINTFSARDFVVFFGIIFITGLFVLVNALANEWIQRYFGFLYTFEGRACLLIFLGALVLKAAALFLITAIACICVGSVELVVGLCFKPRTSIQGSVDEA